MNIKEFIEDQVKFIEDPFVAEVHRLMLEENIQFFITQNLAVRQLINEPTVIEWGIKEYPHWDQLNDDQKATYAFAHAYNAGLKEVRKYTKSVSTSADDTQKFYDVPEISNGFLSKPEGVSVLKWFGGQEHVEELLSSNYFHEVSKILLGTFNQTA